MISVNGVIIRTEHFPDGTQRLMDFPIDKVDDCSENFITWKYESDEELVTLIFIVNHLRNIYSGIKITLKMLYIPNARMDRVYDTKEVNTLKYFCGVINSLGFTKVLVLDPHSSVVESLLDRVQILSVTPYFEAVLKKIIPTLKEYQEAFGTTSTTPEIQLYFPDEGALKRYKKIFGGSSLKSCYGVKLRDWHTGTITGLDVHAEAPGGAVGGKVILMIDDIVSYGGTLAYSADKLHSLGALAVYAFATHVENSVLDTEKSTLLTRLHSGAVRMLYTTDSLFSGSDPSIEIIKP